MVKKLTLVFLMAFMVTTVCVFGQASASDELTVTTSQQEQPSNELATKHSYISAAYTKAIELGQSIQGRLGTAWTNICYYSHQTYVYIKNHLPSLPH